MELGRLQGEFVALQALTANHPIQAGSIAPTAYQLSHVRQQIESMALPLIDEGAALRADPRYLKLPQLLLEPLRVAWPEIETTHGQLLQRAGDLDATDEALKQEADLLEARRKTLDELSAQHRGAIEKWDQECAGSRPEPVYIDCVRRRGELEPVLKAHEETIKAHNENAHALNQKVESLRNTTASLNELLLAWLSKISGMINTIRAFLAASPGNMVCSWTERRIPPENGVCIYDCLEPDGQGGWIVHPGIAIPAQTEGDPCPMRLDFVPVPPAV